MGHLNQGLLGNWPLAKSHVNNCPFYHFTVACTFGINFHSMDFFWRNQNVSIIQRKHLWPQTWFSSLVTPEEHVMMDWSSDLHRAPQLLSTCMSAVQSNPNWRFLFPSTFLTDRRQMVTFYAVLRCFNPCNFNIVHALHNIIIIAIYASLPTLPFVDSFTNITEVNYSFETNLLIHIWVKNSVVKNRGAALRRWTLE